MAIRQISNSLQSFCTETAHGEPWQHHTVTTHLLSIERADWPKQSDLFKASDAKTWKRKFSIGFPVRVCALNLLFVNIFHDVVVRKESRCVIKQNRSCCSIYSFDFALKELHSHWSARAIFPGQNRTNWQSSKTCLLRNWSASYAHE